MDNLNTQGIKGHDHTDELTGLYNINGVLYHLQVNDEYRSSAGTVIIYLNVMNFKSFNQRYGFAGGNEFLRGLADEIRNIFPGELIARIGGDQFIIIAKKLDDETIVDKLKILRDTSAKYEKGLKMRLKAGINISKGDEDDPVVLIDRAKIACDHIIKVYDKDYNFYDEELDRKNELRQYVIDNFEEAFKKKYFRVYYQKEVRAITGKICGFEALARWQDPVKGIISPLVFVEVLESVHLVHKLDICIIDMVCSDLRVDIDSGCCVEPVSVNLSQLDFELCDILSEIDKCREKYDIPTDLLHIEITESAIASGSDFLGQQIKRFRDAGYEVWMDDFGSGYSSFNNLKNYDFDVLKIDMDFLRSFDTNKKSRVILATIVNMAKELGIHTLAEGVETQEQYEFLKMIGCEKLQGYLFGKPVPTDEFDRSKDLTTEFCEDPSFRKYYDSIGEVNLLGNTPLRPKTMDVVNNLPISFVEYENGASSYLFANSAYMSFLSSVGYNTMKSANDISRDASVQEVRKFQEALVRAQEAENHRASVDTISNGSIINSKIRYLASANGKSVFAVVSRNVSLREQNDTTESLRVAMAHVFNQYFRVDLFDEDGTVVNIFLNSEQLAVAERSTDSVKAVAIYADMYLLPEERQRFRDFYYIPTVLDRCKEQNADYLVDYYHSSIPTDKGRMQMYLILPFFYDNRWKYISCCRYADEINVDGWQFDIRWK